jgi:hypothetical protein
LCLITIETLLYLIIIYDRITRYSSFSISGATDIMPSLISNGKPDKGVSFSKMNEIVMNIFISSSIHIYKMVEIARIFVLLKISLFGLSVLLASLF